MLRLQTLIPVAALVAGCSFGAPDAAPSAAVGAVVDTGKITISKPANGVVTITGGPGTVSGAPATTVTLTVIRESPAPTAYRLQHLAGGLPIGSGYASLTADGGWTATVIGNADRPVQTGDELNITPQRGTAQAGFTSATIVP